MKTKAFQIPSVNIQMGKRKQRSTMVEKFTDDGCIIKVEDNVLRGCCDDKDGAYLIDSENQFVDAEDGQSYQIVSDRSTVPLLLRVPKNIENLNQLINDIFAASYETEKRQQFIDAQKDKWGERIMWIITIPFCTLLIMKFL